jgi:hypothetical protein
MIGPVGKPPRAQIFTHRSPYGFYAGSRGATREET